MRLKLETASGYPFRMWLPMRAAELFAFFALGKMQRMTVRHRIRLLRCLRRGICDYGRKHPDFEIVRADSADGNVIRIEV